MGMLFVFCLYVVFAFVLGVATGIKTGWRDGLTVAGGVMGGLLFIALMAAPIIGKELQALCLI